MTGRRRSCGRRPARAGRCARSRVRPASRRRSSTRPSTTTPWLARTTHSGGPAELPALVGDGAAAGLGRVALLVGAVRRADEGAREDGAEAQGLTLLTEPPELVGMHPAVDRRVPRRRLQVLPDRDDVDPVLPEVAHRRDDLVVGLTEADDDSRLRQNGIVGELLRPAEEPEGFLVGRLGAAHPAVKAADRFDVVVEDFWPRGENGPKGVLLDV